MIIREKNLGKTLSHMNPYHDSTTGRFTTANGTFLKAGTVLKSVSGKYANSEMYRNNGRWMYTYRDGETHDEKVYKGPFAKYLVMYRGARFIKEHEYMTTKDLKMPSQQERIDEFKKLKKKQLVNDLESVRSQLVQYGVGDEKEKKEYKEVDLKDLKTDDDWRIAYSIFSHAMEANYYYKSTRDYCKAIEKKYDAMVDDNNKDVYNKAVDPIIIFKANKVLKTISKDPMSGYLTLDEIMKNTDEIGAELRKQGINVKL